MKTDRKIALDIRPFTRIIWKSKKLKDEWKQKIKEASRIYNIAEWKMVAERHRKCGTIHVNKSNYEGILKLLVKDGLFFQPIARTARYSGFSHRHITPRLGEDYDIYGVIASDKKDALRFAELSGSKLNSMHIQIGDLLGYPKCCSEVFTERWSKGVIDPMFEAASMVSPVAMKSDVLTIEPNECSVETNHMLRYFGLRVTSHLPCSLSCQETISRGVQWEKVMKKLDAKAFEDLEKLLKMSLRWDAYRGIVIITTPIFRGITTTGFTEKRHIIKVGKLDW